MIALGSVRETALSDRPSVIARIRNVRTRVWQQVLDWLGGWRQSEDVA